jgi:hypothetical protein
LTKIGIARTRDIQTPLLQKRINWKAGITVTKIEHTYQSATLALRDIEKILKYITDNMMYVPNDGLAHDELTAIYKSLIRWQKELVKISTQRAFEVTK